MTDVANHNAPPNQPDIAITCDGGCLEISWQDGRCSQLYADFLWQNCPSAAGRRRRIDGTNQPPVAGLRIIGVQPIGRYAINISFSDGHDRGIYPWSLLHNLSVRPKMQDFIIPASSARTVDNNAINNSKSKQ